MSSNKDAILKKAQTFMAKGQLDKAISEWEKLISESPNDGNIYNTIGDLHLKKKAIAQSIDSYLKAAEIYHESGFDLKTIAVFKKILKIDPKRHDVCLKLGELNAERGLTGNAISDYLSVAKVFSHEGKILEAIDVYRKIADLDPDNPGIRIKLGEMCVKEGFSKQAAGEFLQGARIYEKAQKKKEAEQYFKKAFELDPENEEVKAAIASQGAKAPTEPKKPDAPPEESPAPVQLDPLEEAEGAVASGDTGRAETLFKKLVKSDPSNADYHRRLGALYLKVGKPEQAFPQLKSAYDSLMSGGQAALAAAVIKEYLAFAPEDRPSHFMLATALEKQNQRDAAFSEYEYWVEETVAAGDLEAARPVYEKIKEWNPKDEKLKRLASQFEEEMAEAPVMEEPVPETSAVELEEPVAERSGAAAPETAPSEISEPSHAGVSREAATPMPSEVLGALDLSESKPEEPVSVNDLFVEGEVYVKYGLKEKALEQFKRILTLDPDHLEARLQLKEIYANEGDAALASRECVRLAKVYRTRGDDSAYRQYMREARELDPSNPSLTEEAEAAGLAEAEQMKELLEEASDALGLKGIERETSTETSAHPVPDFEPETASVPVESGTAEAGSATDEEEYGFAEDVEEADRDPEPVSGRTAAETPSRSEARSGGDEPEISLEDELERSFSVLMDESKAGGKSAKSAPAKTSAKTPEKSSKKQDVVRSEISLEEELEQTFTSLMDQSQAGNHGRAGMEDTLPAAPSQDELMQEISLMHDEKEAETRDEDDYETHYNLGIAYSEMGLINEAIQEFKISCQSSARSVDSHNMLAVCYRKKGLAQDAVLNLQAALRDPHCKDQERKWLSYDLAATYEEAGEPEQALELFNKLYESDPAFKDVEERVESLKKQGANPRGKMRVPETPPAREEDVDAIIEEIMGDSDARESSGDTQNRGKKKSRISYL